MRGGRSIGGWTFGIRTSIPVHRRYWRVGPGSPCGSRIRLEDWGPGVGRMRHLRRHWGRILRSRPRIRISRSRGPRHSLRRRRLNPTQGRIGWRAPLRGRPPLRGRRRRARPRRRFGKRLLGYVGPQMANERNQFIRHLGTKADSDGRQDGNQQQNWIQLALHSIGFRLKVIVAQLSNAGSDNSQASWHRLPSRKRSAPTRYPCHFR